MFSRQANAVDAGSEAGRWLLVGLGNPGGEFELTRHNLGFMLIDLIARRFQVRIKRKECRALVGRAVFENPSNPYYQLFRWAGCQYGDLEQAVGHDGLEPTLQSLRRQRSQKKTLESTLTLYHR